MPVTEIATIPLKAGSNPGDPNDASAAVLKETCDIIKQQDGLQQIHFGMEEENPTVLQMLINWDSIKSHEDFMKSGTYPGFMQRIGSIMDGQANIIHVDFKPDGALAKVFSSPVTELATFTYPGEVDSSYEEGARKSQEWLEKDGEGFLGIAWGTSYEEVEEKGVKGKAVVVAIGWQSVEQHMEFRKRADFGEKIQSLRGGSKAIEMHHVALMQAL